MVWLLIHVSGRFSLILEILLANLVFLSHCHRIALRIRIPCSNKKSIKSLCHLEKQEEIQMLKKHLK